MDPLPLNQVIHGDCIDVMKTFPDNSIDCVVTDPPYGMSFMGKEWDKALPPLAAFTEVCRVLKPGALCFVMSSPRQDLMWRMMKLLEDAGFEVSQSFISWIYKTGFPKAYDVSKGIDSKKKLKRTEYEVDDNFLRRNPVSNHKPDYDGNFNDGLDASKRFKPVSDEARQWDGWKSITGLKPALEPVLMVNKPLSEKTIVDNVLKWGTGAMNVDACRIPINQDVDDSRLGGNGSWGTEKPFKYFGKDRLKGDVKSSQLGRFPANLLVSDGALDTGELSKSGKYEANHVFSRDENGIVPANVYGKYKRLSPEEYPNYADVGDQSRYFDLDAWAEHHGLFDVPKPDKSERDYGLKGSFIILESFMIDETRCKDGNIIQGEQLVRLQMDMELYPPKGIVESGINHKNGIAWNMMLFGKLIMEKYQKDFVSIIKTRKNLTIRSKILTWLTFLLTNEYMAAVKELTENGGNHARIAEKSSQLLITINEKTALALGVKNAASETRLIINVKEEKNRNIHSTVKPIKLMAYLIELGCPRDGVVMDPFVGSGTTCIAAKQLCRRYIGIELSPEYHALAEARIAAYPEPLEWFNVHKRRVK